MPKVELVESVTVLPSVRLVATVYSGAAPIWYGHQIAGLVVVGAGSETVLVECAATVTGDWTVTGVPPPGGVIVAFTVPVCELAVLLVTSVFTVTAEVDRSAAVFCTTCVLLPLSPFAIFSCTGNWMPVLRSGGIWFQSTSSRVYIELGSFGFFYMDRAFVLDFSVPDTSQGNGV